MNSIETFGDATMASLSLAMASLFAAVPKIIGFAVILLVGWFAGTPLSVQPIRKHCGACCCSRSVTKPGVRAWVFAA